MHNASVWNRTSSRSTQKLMVLTAFQTLVHSKISGVTQHATDGNTYGRNACFWRVFKCSTTCARPARTARQGSIKAEKNTHTHTTKTTQTRQQNTNTNKGLRLNAHCTLLCNLLRCANMWEAQHLAYVCYFRDAVLWPVPITPASARLNMVGTPVAWTGNISAGNNCVTLGGVINFTFTLL